MNVLHTDFVVFRAYVHTHMTKNEMKHERLEEIV